MVVGIKRYSILSVKCLICIIGVWNSMRFVYFYFVNLLVIYGLCILIFGGGNLYYILLILINWIKKVKGKSG